MDYTDVYDIMSFFVGGANGENNHDELGKRIGMQGKEWSENHWREVDMQGSLQGYGTAFTSLSLTFFGFQHIFSASCWSMVAYWRGRRIISLQATYKCNHLARASAILATRGLTVVMLVKTSAVPVCLACYW